MSTTFGARTAPVASSPRSATQLMTGDRPDARTSSSRFWSRLPTMDTVTATNSLLQLLFAALVARLLARPGVYRRRIHGSATLLQLRPDAAALGQERTHIDRQRRHFV